MEGRGTRVAALSDGRPADNGAKYPKPRFLRLFAVSPLVLGVSNRISRWRWCRRPTLTVDPPSECRAHVGRAGQRRECETIDYFASKPQLYILYSMYSGVYCGVYCDSSITVLLVQL